MKIPFKRPFPGRLTLLIKCDKRKSISGLSIEPTFRTTGFYKGIEQNLKT